MESVVVQYHRPYHTQPPPPCRTLPVRAQQNDNGGGTVT